MSREKLETSEKVRKSPITPLPASPTAGTACLPVGKRQAGRDYQTVTRIRDIKIHGRFARIRLYK